MKKIFTSPKVRIKLIIMNIKEFLKFLKFTEQFRSTKRAIFAVDEDRMENDTEHSYQLAMVTWYVIENENFKLDSNLAIKYALVHDLEEALNGDVHIFDDKGREDKEAKEIEAMKKIKALFPSWKSYKKLSLAYKKQTDEESKFVNGLDKILPVLNIYLDNGRSWKKENIPLSKLVDNKRVATKVHSFSTKMWTQIEELLSKEEKDLFN